MKSPPAAATLVFFDGACAVCRNEMTWLRRRDHAARLDLIDIAAPAFDAREWPVSVAAMQTLLHVRTADGAWLKGMAAIRHIYRAIGRGWLLAPTGWPLLAPCFDWAYAWFARNRLTISAALITPRCAGGVCRNTRQT